MMRHNSKLYGFYPLAENEPLLPPPDYVMLVDSNYQETDGHKIRDNGRLDRLEFARLVRHPKAHSLNLSSWIPDWHSHERAAVPPISVFSAYPTHAVEPEALP